MSHSDETALFHLSSSHSATDLLNPDSTNTLAQKTLIQKVARDMIFTLTEIVKKFATALSLGEGGFQYRPLRIGYNSADTTDTGSSRQAGQG